MLRDHIPGLAVGAVVVLGAFAAGVEPAPDKTIADWAEEKRYLSADSGSPFPGKWENARVPYLVEPMECLSPQDPCEDITFKKSHQVGGTECYINAFGFVVEWDPSPVLCVLATLDEAAKFARIKLEPSIKETPSIKHKVKDQRTRSEEGSTTKFKKFNGGFCQITGANSSSGLQMISVKYLFCDEISDWPFDVDERGDPLELAEKRTSAWSDTCKRFYNGTPGLEGMCRISAKYEASDQRRYYVPRPQCGHYQVLVWENFHYDEDAPAHDRGEYFECAANHCVIENHQRKDMIRDGVWLKTFKDKLDPSNLPPPPAIAPEAIDAWRKRSSNGRQPGFHIWQAYSPFIQWSAMANNWENSKGYPEKERVHMQQVRGETFEESGEAPDYEKLVNKREDYPMGRIPPEALVLTAMADVQSNRLEWAVYAWGIGLSSWLIDKGVIEGNPEKQAVWGELDQVTRRQYPNHLGDVWGIEAFGVDSGYLSNQVYQFARSRELVFATDGRPGHLLPMIGTPKKVDVNWQGKAIKSGAMIWPLGTFKLKQELYAGLRKTIEGPNADGAFPIGVIHFPMECDEEFFKQITAESLVKVERKNGTTYREWRKTAGRPNEQLDLWVGARAMAAHLGLDHFEPSDWARLAKQRQTPPDLIERGLEAFWAPTPEEMAAQAKQQPATDPGAIGSQLAQMNKGH